MQQGVNTWLDYTIENNPNGVMRVLSKHGYVGYLAPQNYEEMRIYAYELVHNNGDQAVVDLLKAHPEYGAFEELFTSNKYNNACGGYYKNAVSSPATIQEFYRNNKKMVDSALLVLFFLFGIKLGKPTK